MNKQAFELGFQKTALDLTKIISPLVGGAFGAGLGALVNPSDRSKGALVGAGIGAGSGILHDDYGYWNAPIGGGLGAGIGYLAGGTPQDALFGAALGTASSLPQMPFLDSDNILTEIKNRQLTNAALNPLLGAALGGYLNKDNRIAGAMIGAGIGTGLSMPSLASGSIAGLGEIMGIDPNKKVQ